MTASVATRLGALRQEDLALAGAALIALILALTLPGFLTFGNASVLLRNVAMLGILAAGAAVVVIGRGLDISQVAVMIVSSAFTARLIELGVPTPAAMGAGLLTALVCGAANGILVAFAEIPAVFATLGFSILIVGAARIWLLDKSLYGIPADETLILWLGQGDIAGLPVPALLLALVLLAASLFLAFTRWGRFIFAMGDNRAAARLTGIPVRGITVLTYLFSALTAWLAGLVLAGSVASVNLSLANSTLIFDVLIVVVLGGVSLVGGRGGMLSVIAGLALIGLLLNGLTIMNVNSDLQDILKGAVLLAAIVIDTRLHPRDEETARQGDL